MKLAVISDIHADPVSLEKVLTEIDAAGVDRIVCCGDVVGYGPDPKGAIDILRTRQIPCVMGNHDACVREERCLFIGHLHCSQVYAQAEHSAPVERSDRVFDMEPGVRYLMNAGTVGYPRNEPYSTWVLCDTDRGRVEYHSLPFDFADYRRRLIEAGAEVPEWLP